METVHESARSENGRFLYGIFGGLRKGCADGACMGCGAVMEGVLVYDEDMFWRWGR